MEKETKKLSFYDQIEKNKRNSVILTISVFIILMTLVYVISLIFGVAESFGILTIAGVFIIIYTLVTYTQGDKIALAAAHAKPVEETDKKYIHLINIVDGLSIASGIHKPKIFVIESDEINAFATGNDPNNASIAVTTGLLKNLKRDEIEGVIGHEISHIRNYDIRFSTLVAVLVGLVAIVSDILLRSWRYGNLRSSDDRKGEFSILIVIGILLAIFSPIVVRLVQFAVSRKREFLADASGAQLTRYPEGLASALEKIMKFNKGNLKVSEAVSHLFFVDPTKSALDALYATHPPIEERIKILKAMG